MRRLLYLAALSMLAMLVFAPAALAQAYLEPGEMEDGTMMPEEPAPAPAPAPAPVPAPAPAVPAPTTTAPLPDTGGPSLLLPVGALLLASGILSFVALRRTS